jgi:phosphoribosylformylglycinamidine cyclo-ligase
VQQASLRAARELAISDKIPGFADKVAHFIITVPAQASFGKTYKMTQQSKQSLSYRDAGVDISAGDELVERIKPFAKKTLREGVLSGLGGFGALFEVPRRYREPVLVSGTDGVGTKLKLAFELKRHDTVGIDLVAMSVNDVLVQGAEPLFFLDYFACGKLDVDTAASVIEGIAKGCEHAGCALIGGETAEMPGMYPEGEYDLAGFAVGVVEKSAIITGQNIMPGDAVIGLPSSGAHSNGYSLVRKIIARSNPDLAAAFDVEGTPTRTLADAIMAPTRIYVKPMLALMAALPVKGMAHITGGGITENVPRVLPEAVKAVIEQSSWPRPRLFQWLQSEGNVAEGEMHRVFNCGIGMVVIVASEHVQQALHLLHAAGEKALEIGRIEVRADGEAQTIVV